MFEVKANILILDKQEDFRKKKYVLCKQFYDLILVIDEDYNTKIIKNRYGKPQK